MAAEMVTIEAKDRKETGKGFCKKLRKAGRIPAVILEKGKSTLIELDPKWLGKAHMEGKKFNLSYNDQTRPVTIKELHIDVLKRTPLHVDLMYLS